MLLPASCPVISYHKEKTSLSVAVLCRKYICSFGKNMLQYGMSCRQMQETDCMWYTKCSTVLSCVPKKESFSLWTHAASLLHTVTEHRDTGLRHCPAASHCQTTSVSCPAGQGRHQEKCVLWPLCQGCEVGPGLAGFEPVPGPGTGLHAGFGTGPGTDSGA